VRAALGTSLLVVATIAGIWFTATPRPSGPNDTPARVLIPTGASFHVAAESLATAGLIRWPRIFALYGSYRGRDRTIRAGTYRLRRGQPWDVLIDALHTGKGAVATVVVPEGWPLRRIVPYLSKELQIPADSLEAAVRDSAMRARLGVPTESLEGYLFPDTYVIPLGTTARQVVALMVTRFEHAWKPEWTARLDTLHRSRHEIMTLASIVEGEVQKPDERPVVAAVYWNRLRAKMFLQADPTVLYANGKWASRVYYRDLDVQSPYNTYRHTGLPPGPIDSPGAAAIEGTLYPAQVPYRYFVAAPDGHHEFRKTFEEHEAAIQQIRAAARAKARADSLAARADSSKPAGADSAQRGGARAGRRGG